MLLNGGGGNSQWKQGTLNTQAKRDYNNCPNSNKTTCTHGLKSKHAKSHSTAMSLTEIINHWINNHLWKGRFRNVLALLTITTTHKYEYNSKQSSTKLKKCQEQYSRWCNQCLSLATVMTAHQCSMWQIQWLSAPCLANDQTAYQHQPRFHQRIRAAPTPLYMPMLHNNLWNNSSIRKSINL